MTTTFRGEDAPGSEHLLHHTAPSSAQAVPYPARHSPFPSSTFPWCLQKSSREKLVGFQRDLALRNCWHPKAQDSPQTSLHLMTHLYSADSGYLSKYSQTQPRANTRGIPPWPYPGAWTIIGVLRSPASRSSSAPPCGDKPPAQPLQHR